MSAARSCLECSLNGFTDWYLPTKEEMQTIYYVRNILDKVINKRHNINGMFSGKYWCSNLDISLTPSENNCDAWVFDFEDGKLKLEHRYSLHCVLAVRKF